MTTIKVTLAPYTAPVEEVAEVDPAVELDELRAIVLRLAGVGQLPLPKRNREARNRTVSFNMMALRAKKARADFNL